EGAVAALCELMRRWPADADVLAGAAFALRSLLEADASVAAAGRSAGAPQRLRAALAEHPARTELQHEGLHALQLLATLGGSGGPVGWEDDPGSGRRGLASALLERRAADATRPDAVSTAMGWLLSGGRSPAGLRARQGSSEPPGRRARAPAPCMPAPAPPQGVVPRLDSRATPRRGTTDGWSSPLSGPPSASAPSTGREGRSSSRAARPTPPRRWAATAAERDESPHTPPAARLPAARLPRWEAGYATANEGSPGPAGAAALVGGVPCL
ncbi:unnamed protein product, partial [Prorocentrum cordatum]